MGKITICRTITNGRETFKVKIDHGNFTSIEESLNYDTPEKAVENIATLKSEDRIRAIESLYAGQNVELDLEDDAANFELSFSTIPSASGGIALYILRAQSIENQSWQYEGPQEKLDSLNNRLAYIKLNSSRLQNVTNEPPVSPIRVNYADILRLGLEPQI